MAHDVDSPPVPVAPGHDAAQQDQVPDAPHGAAQAGQSPPPVSTQWGLRSEGHGGETWWLAEVTAVGRHGTNDMALRQDGRVSRTHCRFEPTEQGWLVIDLDSTCGTWVNGERITRRALGDGDTIDIASYRFTVVAPEA